MTEEIKKLDEELIKVSEIVSYLEQFSNYEVIKEDLQSDNGEIRLICGKELIILIYLKITNGKWWSIYRYHENGIKYEQIDCIMYDQVKDRKYDQVIKYAGHIEDDSYSYIICSSFVYLNQKLKTSLSFKKTRVVPIYDLDKIQYTKNMNLTELIIMADKNSNVVRKKKEENPKNLVLKLEKCDI